MKKEEVRYIGGRNAALEVLHKPDQIKRAYFCKNGDQRLQIIINKLNAAEIEIIFQEMKALDKLLPNVKHQGVVIELKPFAYADFSTVLNNALEHKENALFVLLDGIEDVHNLGAIIRSAECASADALLLPERRSASITATVTKTSAGAVEVLPIVKIGNIVQTIGHLKEKGFWIVGADITGEHIYWDASLTGPLVLVIGSEQNGMRHLTKKYCDFLVRIPMNGKISSLNASVAAALLIYEIRRQQIRGGES